MKKVTKKAIEREMSYYYQGIAIVARNNAIRAHIAGDLKAHKLLKIVDIDFALVQEEAIKFSKPYGGMLMKEGASMIRGEKVPWLKNNTERTRQKVFEIIEKGLKEGKPVSAIGGKRIAPGSIAYDLKQTLIRDKDYEYVRISRTEIDRIQSHATETRYKEKGVKQVGWLCGQEPCAECAALCGHIFAIDGVPERPVHPNCTCDVKPIIEK